MPCPMHALTVARAWVVTPDLQSGCIRQKHTLQGGWHGVV